MTALELGLFLLGVFALSFVMLVILIYITIEKELYVGKWNYGYLTLPVILFMLIGQLSGWGGSICLFIALLQYMQIL